MNIFITGVAGFLGSHLADAMLAEGHRVIGVDSMIGGELDNVPAGVAFGVVDCNEYHAMRGLMAGCDIVYHCAATAYEGLSVFSPHVVTQNIFGAATSVFSAAIANKVKRIVHCSSMARYGAIDTPFTENMICRPQDPYGIAKLAAESMLRNLCATHGVEYVIAVPHNIIGPRQKYDDPYRNVASIMINLLLQNRRPVIYGDGKQERCFSDVVDCLACLKKMAFQEGLSGETINIGPDEYPITIYDLFSLLTSLTGKYVEPIYMPGRPKEVKVAVCSSDKARRLLGYQTSVPLDVGLQRMIDAINLSGPRPFKYHLDLEIVTDKTPKTWTDKLF